MSEMWVNGLVFSRLITSATVWELMSLIYATLRRVFATPLFFTRQSVHVLPTAPRLGVFSNNCDIKSQKTAC